MTDFAASLRQTREAGTAKLWYSPSLFRPFSLPGAPFGSPREVWRWAKSGHRSGRPAGEIDLQRPRSLYHQLCWHLFVDGEDWYGAPEEWERRDDDGEPCLCFEDPHWLLTIVAGCVAARPVDSKEIGGEQWTRTRLRCDFRRAAEHTDLPLIPPLDILMAADNSAEDFDATRLDVPDIEIDAITDGSGRIRRLIRHEPAGVRDRGELALDDFGVGVSLEPPPSS